ncbi:hypothetical protein CRYUN_Cryun07bG0170400 [Craigia yunnanensis]
MASKASATIALLLSLNLLFFSMANATDVQLSACANIDVNACFSLLGGLGLTKGCACCGVIANLVQLDAEVCLCALINANILGLVNLAAVNLDILLSTCDLHPTKTYSCA